MAQCVRARLVDIRLRFPNLVVLLLLSLRLSAGERAKALALKRDSSIVVMVTFGGSGYVTTPQVTLTGGGGTGATAKAILNGDKIAGIQILTPGTGYSEGPTVTIEAPPKSRSLVVRKKSSLKVNGLPGSTNRIEWSSSPTGPWIFRTNVVVGVAGNEVLDMGEVADTEFYRIRPTAVAEPSLQAQGLALRTVASLTVDGPPGSTSQIDWSFSHAGPWTIFTNVVVGVTAAEVVDTSLSSNARVYRVRETALVWIEPGTFVMGSPESESGGRRWGSETQRTVTIPKGYWIGRHEVTQEEYSALMGTNPSTFKGDDMPVQSVNWFSAVHYCNLLTVKEHEAGRLPVGYAYRLPTEAQWEYACRAGTTTATAFGDNLGAHQANIVVRQQANIAVAIGKTTPVGSYGPNAWGLYDMHGNVKEWCDSVLYLDEGPAFGRYVIFLRGGSWYDDRDGCRSAVRQHADPSTGLNYWTGFRVALVPVQ